MRLAFVLLITTIVTLFATPDAKAAVVSFKDDQLHLDGAAQPQLFGAELQYFRLRGAYGPNVPRARVLELWNKALDKMVEAKMNAIIFYIPWDFHEYAEGKFDFTGTVDEDKDGNPDYPARDVQTFFKLVEQHGIKRIMVRPGPYINAEWGFKGFGAVPKWFADKFPNSHMRSPTGKASTLYDYHDPDFLSYSERWMRTLYTQVLKDKIGPGKPISFVQLDNETNFQWQSIFNVDYGPRALTRYRDFVRAKYQTIQALNKAHGRTWTKFENVMPASVQGRNQAEDAEWYQFQDESIRTYLEKIRRIWENLGVTEPTVLFTLAESYNAAPQGLLPHFMYRNEPGRTGLMTVNLYPKTYELASKPLLNLPFKADHDVKAADSANDYYLGSRQEWVMGPEIQGGWWRGIEVTTEARRQTYLTTLGHGLKALFVYYFTEGHNWQSELGPSHQGQELYFDAPLDKDLNPRPHYQDVKKLGENVIAPYASFLGRARAMTDDVCFLREDAQHAYSPNTKVDALAMNGEWAGGLIGALSQSGLNPKILHWGLTPQSELDTCEIVIRQDNGIQNAARTAAIKSMLGRGKTVVNLIDSTLTRELGLPIAQYDVSSVGTVSVSTGQASFTARATPLFSFAYPAASACKSILMRGTSMVGFSCAVGSGQLVQIGSVFYDRYNSDHYGAVTDVAAHRALIDSILATRSITPRTHVVKGGDRTVLFGRTDGTSIMLFTKSGNDRSSKLVVTVREVTPSTTYRVRDLFTGAETTLLGKTIQSQGLEIALTAYGSTAVAIEPSN